MKHNLNLVDDLLIKLNTHRPLKPEDQNRLDKKFRLEFNYNSNHIEGNTLTYGETELLLMFDDTIGSHHMREYEETKAHDVAYQVVEELSKDDERPLTEQLIKNLNEIILVRPYWKDAITPDGQSTRRQINVGSYKEFPNSVRLQNGEIFHYASPSETLILMQELIQWYRDEEIGLHPVTLATMLHYKFVRIHPFDDGNGRISRLLLNYVLLKHHYPPVIIKSSDKDNYLRALHIADIGDYEPLIDYIAQQSLWSLKMSIKAANGELLDDTDDYLKEIELLRRKTSNKSIPKSPGVIYDSFNLINKKIWNCLLKTLGHFDILFNEVKNDHSVNNYSEIFDKKYVSKFEIGLLAKTEVSQEPAKLKVFGFDVYEWDVSNVTWRHNMYGLHGAENPTDLVISLNVNFNNNSYNLKWQVKKIVVYEVEKNYGQSFLNNEINEMETSIKSYIINYIKEKVI